jgi:integrase
LKTLVETYLEHIKATGSAERYAMQVQHVNAHLLRNFRSLEELASEARWSDYDAMRRRSGMATRTVAKELSTFRTFAKWCKQRRLIDEVPEYQGPRIRSDFQALCLEPEQIEAILAALPEKVRHGRAWGQAIRARFVFAWETSLRPATVARIRVEDYDAKHKRLQIRESADKARFGRELPLTEPGVPSRAPAPRRVLSSARPGSATRSRPRPGLQVCRRTSRGASRRTPFVIRESRTWRRSLPICGALPTSLATRTSRRPAATSTAT